jgi:parallel beta-helix repeat protein
MRPAFTLPALGAGLLIGCSNGPQTGTFPTTDCNKLQAGTCIEIAGGDIAALQLAVNSIDPDTTIVLGSGRFMMKQQLTIRTAGVKLIGQGIDVTTLDFKSTTTQGNGVDVVGDGFLIQDLTVSDTSKDGIRVEDTNGVTFRRIRAVWSTPSQATNGGYGIYPVRSQNVLVEDSRGENASDAGLYVGQCQHVIVRNNTAQGNIAGIEIESTEYADIYGNTAENNVTGLLVFDFPGNPIIGRDIRVHDNMVRNNNLANFAPGGVSSTIPSGTGTFVMAARRVEVTNNMFQHNDTSDIGLISGLSFTDVTMWTLNTANLIGAWQDLGLPSPGPGMIANYRTENIVIAGNSHSGSGTMPSQQFELGMLLSAHYQGAAVDSVLYDTVGETSFSSTDPAGNTNVNHMCLGGNTGGSFASMALDQQTTPTPFYRPAAPFAPFDCTTLAGGPISPVVLP